MFVLFQGHTDELWGLDVHPSMEQFITCAQDKLVQLWDTNSHQPLWSKAIDVSQQEERCYLFIFFHSIYKLICISLVNL